MSEADVNNLLPGYHIDQLREVWGKPDTSENSTACWKLGNDTTLVVSYKNNGIVAICGLKDDSDASIGELQFPVCSTPEDRFGGPLFLYCMALLPFLRRVGRHQFI